MILDLILVSGAVISIGIGYSKGLIASLLSLVGYFGGAIAALYAAMKLSENWKGVSSTVLLYLGSILLGATLGREIFSRIGKSIHTKFLFGPFRFLDSMLGGVLSFLQYALILLISLTILRYLPLSFCQNWISGSKIYKQASEINLLSFQISDLLRSVSSHLDQLKS